jgi:hypothetical protein
MALPINKTLQGSQTLEGGNTYQLVLPTNLAPKQNALAEYNLEECYISVNTSLSAKEIILPKIADFGGDRSVKIYIFNSAFIGNNLTVRGYNVLLPTVVNNSINGVLGSAGTVTVLPTETGWFQIVSNNNWAYFCTPTLLP